MMAELTDNPAYRQGLPEYHEVLRIPWFDYRDPRSGEKSLAKLKEHVEKYPGQISVFVFEPMLGEGGYMPAPREFFVPLLNFCKEQGIPVWADEVQTFCRTREPFAFQFLELGEWVDLVTVAKTAQVGMTLYTEEMNPKPGLIAGTFSGSTVALNAGMAIFRLMKEGGYWGVGGRIDQIHQRMVNGLRELAETTCVGKLADPAGMGLMVAFTPLDGKKETVDILLKKFFDKGLIVFNCGKNPVRIRMLIPAVIQDQEIDLALRLIEEVLIEGV
jgi:acetylornithine/N-succinyldiaminopimelate aminotransferase